MIAIQTDGASATPASAGACATPDVMIARPSDDYDPLWIQYNKQNPRKLRSVGADAAPAGEGEGDGGSAGAPPAGDGGAPPAGDGEPTAPPAGGHFSDGYGDDATKKLAARYNSEEEMAAALRSANTELSSRVKAPGADASEEEVAAFRKTMGVPDDITGYAIEKPEHMEEATFKDEGMQTTINGIVTEMHKAGATKDVVDATLGAYWAMEAATQKATAKMDTAASEAADAALRTKWGKNYAANMALAEQVTEEFPDLGNLELKDGTLVGSSPHFAELLSLFGRQRAEGVAQTGIINTEGGADVKTEYDRLTAEMHTAHQSGDRIKAQQLDDQRRPLGVKLYGTGTIGGQDMR